MPHLSWLHLSDWHQRGKDFDRTVVRDALLDDIKRRVDIDPRLAEIDFVVFSGDAAFRGVKTEFEAARTNLFDPVLKELELTSTNLFFVPGNHDLNRDVVSDMLPKDLQSPLQTADQVKKWLTDDRKRVRAMEPFEDYTAFVKEYTGQGSPEFASVVRLNVRGHSIALLGLNSSWMCGRNLDDKNEVNDYGFLAVGEPQLHEALASIQNSDVRIAVIHHPFAWLGEFERNLIESRLKAGCHFILRGHEHEQGFDLSSSIHGECAVIPAGASYDRREASHPRFVNAYNFVHLDWSTAKGVLFFRRWSERRTKWIEDLDTCSGGRHEFALPKQLGQSKSVDVAGPRDTATTIGLEAMETDYRARVIDSFKNLTFRGLTNTVRPILLPLEKVYVQLRAVAEVPESADEFTPEERRVLRALDGADEENIDASELREAQLRLDALRRERWTKERLERFPISDALKDPARRGLVILGDPGSGKSTLLNFLALVFARGSQAVKEYLGIDGIEAERLPIIAPLAAYDDMLNTDASLTIRAFLAKYYERQNIPGLAPLFERAIETGRALILLDGMDEVLDEGRRKFVAEQASVFIRALIHGGNRVLLTSRIYGYRTAPLSSVDLPHVTVLDFRREEIEVFARQWNTAMTEWEFADRSEADRQVIARESERELLDEIRSNPGVQKLAANPLLLSMLSLLRRQVGRLPQQRIRLYSLYLGALIESWESIRSRGARVNSPPQPDATKSELVLIPLALWLQNNKPSGTATEVEIVRQIMAVYLREAGLQPDLAPDAPGWSETHVRARQFLEDMRQFSGLLVERGHGVFGFRHLTFQEYYVGRSLARMSPTDRWNLLQRNLHANRWREPIMLAAAQLGNMQADEEVSTALVTSILNAGSDHEQTLHRDLFLAADCASDDINVGIVTLRQIVQRLQPLVSSEVSMVAEEAIRKLVGLAMLMTGDRLRLPEATEVLLQFVTSGNVLGSGVFPAFAAITGRLYVLVPELRDAVVQKLDDQHYNVRSAAITALAPLLAEQIPLRDAVVQKLDDQNYSVRSAAITALAPCISSANVRRRLEPALRTDDGEFLRRNSYYSFPRRILVQAWARWVSIERQQLPEVIKMLSSEDSRLRQSAAEILLAVGKDAVAQAASQLLIAMDDFRGYDSWPARIAAAELLINDVHYSRSAIDTLLPALEYGAHPLILVPNAAEIRKSAALALGKLKADECRPHVAEKLKSLLETESDRQVLNGLYSALLSLVSAPT